MRKILSILLCAAMLMTMVVFAGCDNKEDDKAETLKFGFAVEASVAAVESATADKEGKGEAVVNAAAVLVDADGKIVKCVIDTADNTVKFTADGKAVQAEEFKTKYEQGEDYGMVAYGGAAKEWFEQVDAFTSAVVGKTADEVKALVAEDGKTADEILTAGCTIGVSEFVAVVVEAVNNAAESDATADSKLQLGIVSSQSECKDATAEAEGSNVVDTTVVAAAVDAEGKVVAMATDALQAKFAFDAAGVCEVELGAIKTKDDLGADYGMVAYGGAAKEWNEQADAFDATCVGKTATEIAALVAENGYNGVDALVSAGCTIGVADMVKAAVKAATVA
ncbi:MAG: hypothetical protein J6C03_05880 [Clostridia bacterium]|nr:hypothetical protein [Clostridia bacterium]